MKVLGIDIGYGHSKVVYGDETGVDKLYKEVSALAVVENNSMATDTRIVEFDGKSYYVGDDAMSLQSSSIIDITNYKELEYSAPIFVLKVIRDLNAPIDILVLGLSISQMNNSGYFKDRVNEFLKSNGVDITIKLVPQGMIAKMTIDEYGLVFPDKPKEFSSLRSYVAADVGFNTLDIFQVINGKTSTNLVRGIENRGIQVIVHRLLKRVKDRLGITLSVNEGKSLLKDKVWKIRGQRHSFSTEVEEEVKSYVSELMIIIENEFGSVLDKSDGLILFGGGAYSLESALTNFIRAPKDYSEFYNVIAFYLYGINQKKEQ